MALAFVTIIFVWPFGHGELEKNGVGVNALTR